MFFFFYNIIYKSRALRKLPSLDDDGDDDDDDDDVAHA